MNQPIDPTLSPHRIGDHGTYRCCDPSTFDAYASSYEEALARGLSITGEPGAFFARGRVAWLARRLQEMAERPRRLLDFGCGTGAAVPFFLELLSVESIIGIDDSTRSLAVARDAHAASAVRFLRPGDYTSSGEVDLVFTNGVFHHIPPGDREQAARYTYRVLRRGGFLAFWENNPWNPGTRYVMWRIPFDRDAVPVWPSEARRLLQVSGFEILRTDFLFLFPRILGWLRWLEPHLAPWPLGAQYQILCRKPPLAP